MRAFLTAIFVFVASLAQAANVPLLDFWDPTNNLGTFNDWIINSLDPALVSSGVVAGPGWANVLAYGADPSGVADSTSQFNTALATGSCVYAPAGTYKITNAITFPTHNWCFFGDGETKTVLNVNSASFNLAARGVIVIPNNSGGDGGRTHDFGIAFTQPDTAVRANLVAFPPGIYMQNVARAVIDNVQIGGAITCIDGRGNSGGIFLNTINCGSFTDGIILDGALDANHIHAFHEYPFGISGHTGLTAVWQDQTNNCLNLGRVDGLEVTNLACFRAKVVFTANATASADTMAFSSANLDASSMVVAGGNIEINDISWGFAGTGPPSGGTWNPELSVTGGTILIGQYRIGGTQPAQGQVLVSGGTVHLANGIMSCLNITAPCAVVSGGNLRITGSSLSPIGAGGTLTAPYVQQTGGNLAMLGNKYANNASVSGSGAGVTFATDAANNVFLGNATYGWPVNLPATQTSGFYGPVEGSFTANVSADTPGLAISSISGVPARATITSTGNDAANVYFKQNGLTNYSIGVGTANALSITHGPGVTPFAIQDNLNMTLGVAGQEVRSLGTLRIPQATWADNQTCAAGQISADASFIYVCTTTDTVKRAALSAF